MARIPSQSREVAVIASFLSMKPTAAGLVKSKFSALERMDILTTIARTGKPMEQLAAVREIDRIVERAARLESLISDTTLSLTEQTDETTTKNVTQTSRTLTSHMEASHYDDILLNQDPSLLHSQPPSNELPGSGGCPPISLPAEPCSPQSLPIDGGAPAP